MKVWAKRTFVMTTRIKPEGKLCRSLPLMGEFAQTQFMMRYEALEAQIKHSGPDYAMKLLRTANRLMGKK
jgi:hypothetical protein